MPGLLDSLSLGSRAMQTHQKGVAVAGHNLANVNNTAYARQRLTISTSTPVDSAFGPLGNGVDGTAVTQIRNTILDSRIQVETSARGSLEAQQEALELTESSLGEPVAGATGGASGLTKQLAGLFNAFQSAATTPTSSAERSSLLAKATELASQFQQVDRRLASLSTALDQSLRDDTAGANQLVAEIAQLNREIDRTENSGGNGANDLRDLRQEKLESLARLVKVETATNENGGLEISVAGTTLVSGGEVTDQLEAFTADDGSLGIRAQAGGTDLNLTGGRLQGTMAARDGALKQVRTDLNATASALISEVNALHREGFDLNGGTGADLFTGTNAADIAVNPDLRANVNRLQLAGSPDAKGDGAVALRLAQLAGRSLAELGDRTLGAHYGQAVANVGEARANVESSLADQKLVDEMLLGQRQSISGVSLDEEMADLMKYQNAYAASAKLIATIDEMLNDVINLKR